MNKFLEHTSRAFVTKGPERFIRDPPIRALSICVEYRIMMFPSNKHSLHERHVCLRSALLRLYDISTLWRGDAVTHVHVTLSDETLMGFYKYLQKEKKKRKRERDYSAIARSEFISRYIFADPSREQFR